jgi:hypothetical protein
LPATQRPASLRELARQTIVLEYGMSNYLETKVSREEF